MTKATNYLATVTDVNSVFTAKGSVIPNSQRCVIKDDTGQTVGSVGAINHWYIDDTASPLVTYTNPRLPRWQDLIPLNTVGSTFIDALYVNSGSDKFALRLYQSNPSVVGYNSYVIISSDNTQRHIASNQTLATSSYLVAGFAPSISGSVMFYRFAINIAKLKVDYPGINVFTFNLYAARLVSSFNGNFTVRTSIKYSSLIDTPPFNGVDFSSAQPEGVFTDVPTKICGTVGTYAQIGYFTYNKTANTFVYTDLQGTGCVISTDVTIYPYNSLPTSSYTVYVNGVADPTWTSGTRSYPLGTTIYINYAAPACGVLLNSNPYSSGTVITISDSGIVYYFELLNAAHWTTTGYTCIGNVQYTNQVNDCGGTQQFQTNPGSTCDCYCNQTCAGTYYGDPQCGTGEYGNAWVQYPRWVCTGNLTGGPPNVLDDCSCNCNPSCDGFTYTAQYCGQPGRYGTNTSTLYQDRYFACTGGYAGTDTIDDCSCQCNQTCDGTYWEYYCSNYGVYPYERRRRQRWTCSGNLTGVDESVGNCSLDCGANTSAIWETTASYCLGDPTKPGNPACILWVTQKQVNQCCNNPAYNSERFISLGTNSYCYYTYPVYHCVGTDEWVYDFNPCNGAITNDHLYQICSPQCGGDLAVYYELSECGGSGYAFTKIAPDNPVYSGQRYVLPYPVETFYTYTGNSTEQCTAPPGYNGSIQKTSYYYCP